MSEGKKWFVPVILDKTHHYNSSLNKEAREELSYLYEAQYFPQIGDWIHVQGWDGEVIEERDFILKERFPMIYLTTSWPDINNEETECYLRTFEIEKIYNKQVEILGLQ